MRRGRRALIMAGFGAAAADCAHAAAQGNAPGRVLLAREASERLVAAIRSVEGCFGVQTARAHEGGVELIFAWFRDRAAVLRWFEHEYHRQLLRDAGREEDHIAANHFGDDVGPILVLASVAYDGAPGSLAHSMFDDPVAGRPSRFAVEYYTPLAGGAYMEVPFAPAGVAQGVVGLRNVYED